jgi:hypothetical protein
VSLLTLMAAVVYLLPIVSFTALRSRKTSSLFLLATDLTLAIAVDLLGVMLLARFMRLELASIVSRGLWLSGLVAFAVWRAKKRDLPARPTELDWKLCVGVLFQSLSALLLSRALSRSANIWDRDWHVPLTASLRGQRLPFSNVYEPKAELAYHYTGDLLGSMLQTYSSDAMHSTLALSLAHDVMFALLAVVVAFTLAAVGIKRVALQWLVLVAIVFAGPMTIAQDPKQESGYSIGNLLSLSYRPHVSLAFVLTIGFGAALLAGVYRSKVDIRRRVFPTLVATSALLAMTDEITLVLLGLWIGVVWLYDPRSLADTRVRGALRLSLLVVAIVGTILAFGGSLGLHAQRYPMWLVAPRSPGWNQPIQPLSSAIGRSWLTQDMFAAFGVFVAALGFIASSRRRETRVVAVSFLALTLVATFGLTCIDFNHSPVENHRWATLPLVFAPLLGAFMVAEPDAIGGPRRAAGISAAIVYVSCGLAAASTVYWLWGGAGGRLMGPQIVGRHRLYDLNCRELTGAHLLERTAPTYVEDRGVYVWIGCHPTFIPSMHGYIDKHHIKTGAAASGPAALEELFANMLEPGAPLTVACASDGAKSDRICSAARAKGVGTCKPAGSEFTLCTVPSSQRKRLARH